jgi:septal ring factor EnvC (AmiA/AmiB activator)
MFGCHGSLTACCSAGACVGSIHVLLAGFECPLCSIACLQAALQQSGMLQQQLSERQHAVHGLEMAAAQQGGAMARLEAQLAEMQAEAQSVHAMLARSEQDRDALIVELQAAQVLACCFFLAFLLKLEAWCL